MYCVRSRSVGGSGSSSVVIIVAIVLFVADLTVARTYFSRLIWYFIDDEIVVHW